MRDYLQHINLFPNHLI